MEKGVNSMKIAKYEAPWGQTLLGAEGEYLVGLWTDGDKAITKIENAEIRESGALTQTMKWLDAYFDRTNPSIHDLPLLLQGSEFQQLVWSQLMGIPYGETVTYGAIAKRIAQQRGLQRMSAQAVGGAVGRNPIGIIVPCHRVIGSDGSLTGYAGGIDVKRWLLRHEGVNI